MGNIIAEGIKVRLHSRKGMPMAIAADP